MKKCSTCYYFEEIDEASDDEYVVRGDMVGSCVRYPPVLVDPSKPCHRASWEVPIVVSSMRCGEWSQKRGCDD